MEIFLHRKILCLVILLVFPTVESQESSKNFKKIIKMLKNLDGKVANIDLQIQQLTNKVEENSGKIDVLTSFVQTIVPDLKNEIKEKFSCHFCPEEEMGRSENKKQKTHCLLSASRTHTSDLLINPRT